MDQSRLSINATGAYLHPLGDQTPIDCRYGETIDSVDLPHRELQVVSAETLVGFGRLINPRAVILWNVSGQGLQVQPTPEQAASIAAQVLHVGLISGQPTPDLPTGWQEIRPARPGCDTGGSTILWLSPGTRVIIRPAVPGVSVLVRTLVLPGQ